MVSRVRRTVRPAVTGHESVQTVTVKPHGAEETATETREVHKFVTEPAYVRVAAGVTKSMGPSTYEFLRLDVSVSVPCYVEMIESTYQAVSEQVAALIDEEVTKYMGEYEGA